MKGRAPHWSDNHAWFTERNTLILKAADMVNNQTELFCLRCVLSETHKTANLSSVNEGSQPEHIYAVATSIIHAR